MIANDRKRPQINPLKSHRANAYKNGGPRRGVGAYSYGSWRRKIHFITLLGGIFPPRHYKAVMFTRETDCSATHIQQASFQCATITRLAALLQSGAGDRPSPPRFHVSVRGEWTLLCSDTRQMFHSNVAFAYCGGSNEFSQGRPRARFTVSRLSAGQAPLHSSKIKFNVQSAAGKVHKSKLLICMDCGEQT